MKLPEKAWRDILKEGDPFYGAFVRHRSSRRWTELGVFTTEVEAITAVTEAFCEQANAPWHGLAWHKGSVTRGTWLSYYGPRVVYEVVRK